MKRALSLILALCMAISCLALLAGCSSDGSSAGYPVTVGDTVIKKEPKNIIVLNDELADIISYLGYDIRMVGRSSECDQDFLYVVPIVGAAASPDISAVTNAETDLVIADGTLNANTKQSLEDAGVTVLTLDPPSNEEELRGLYISLGTALDGSETGAEKGEQGYNDLYKMLNTLNTATSSVLQSAAYLYLDGSGQLCTFVKDTLAYKVFSFNGCTNVFLNQTEPAVNVGELKVSSPNYIFYDSPEVLEYLKSDPGFANISGLANGHTLQIPLKQFERHGSTAEQTVFEMLNYIEKITKATPDEAAAEAPATEAQAAEAAVDATQAAEAAVDADNGYTETYADDPNNAVY